MERFHLLQGHCRAYERNSRSCLQPPPSSSSNPRNLDGSTNYGRYEVSDGRGDFSGLSGGIDSGGGSLATSDVGRIQTLVSLWILLWSWRRRWESS